MGLNMYLYKKTYVQNWDHQKDEDRHKITILRGGEPRKDIKPERIAYVLEQVCYWQKANQIHAWFVNNVQDGVDDCREAYVSEENLKQLVKLCQTVIESPEKAPELMPTQSGFFFGSEEYGEYYFEDLRDTVTRLVPVLEEGESEGFYYNSSW